MEPSDPPRRFYKLDTFTNDGGATVLAFLTVNEHGWAVPSAPARYIARVTVGGPAGATGTLDVPLLEARSLGGAFAIFDDRMAMEKLVAAHVQRMEAQQSRILRAGQQGPNGAHP